MQLITVHLAALACIAKLASADLINYSFIFYPGKLTSVEWKPIGCSATSLTMQKATVLETQPMQHHTIVPL
jgi:hypothetical protein